MTAESPQNTQDMGEVEVTEDTPVEAMSGMESSGGMESDFIDQ